MAYYHILWLNLLIGRYILTAYLIESLYNVIKKKKLKLGFVLGWNSISSQYHSIVNIGPDNRLFVQILFEYLDGFLNSKSHLNWGVEAG